MTTLPELFAAAFIEMLAAFFCVTQISREITGGLFQLPAMFRFDVSSWPKAVIRFRKISAIGMSGIGESGNSARLGVRFPT